MLEYTFTTHAIAAARVDDPAVVSTVHSPSAVYKRICVETGLLCTSHSLKLTTASTEQLQGLTNSADTEHHRPRRLADPASCFPPRASPAESSILVQLKTSNNIG